MRRFFAHKENITNQRVVLDGEETRHLRGSLRLSKGDRVRVFDGAGREFLCEIESIEKETTRLILLDEIAPTAPESKLDLTLAAAITKGEKFDLVVQKSVELGVSRVIPVFTARCDVKRGGSERRLARWRKIVSEATKQSGRAKLMGVSEPVDFRQLVESKTCDDLVLFSERCGVGLKEIKPAAKFTALVGPEGGWDDPELDLARKNHIQIVTLRGRILRAETASIVLAALLQHRFGDLN